ncbi:hypothetical protein ACP3UV_08495 [Mixta calida]
MTAKSGSQVQPGYCIVQQPGTLASQAQMIFQDRNRDAINFFMQINNDTPWVKPGQILIVADPNNSNQAYQLYELKKSKEKVNHALATTDVPGNDSNLLIVFYVQIMPDDFVMQLHRF